MTFNSNLIIRKQYIICWLLFYLKVLFIPIDKNFLSIRRILQTCFSIIKKLLNLSYPVIQFSYVFFKYNILHKL